MEIKTSFFKKLEIEIANYLDQEVEISPGVRFSQSKLINRVNLFKNQAINQSKLNEDLSYDYYFDIISPRVDAQVKNLRFDSKNIMVYSSNQAKDFAAVYIANSQLKTWMAENGEDDKLKDAVEEFVEDGTIIFKKVDGTYETVDLLNTIITNQTAKNIDDTNIIERHEMTHSQLKSMTEWNTEKYAQNCANKTFTSSIDDTTDIDSTNPRYEVYEYTGEMTKKELQELKALASGKDKKITESDSDYVYAKVIVGGLDHSHNGDKYCLFAQEFGKNETMSDYYKDAHRGRYKGRFLRNGLYEDLIDHQIRANDIGNQIAAVLDWASRVIFKSSDEGIVENIRTDLENGDVITTTDISQLEVRGQGVDQLIADWNRLMQHADQIANSYEVVTGETMPSGTPFRQSALLDQNAGELFTFMRQKLTMTYKRVFKEWILQNLIDDLSSGDIFKITGDAGVIDEFRKIMVDSWFVRNLAIIGPHTREDAIAIKQAKLDEIKNIEPVIENADEIWEKVQKRLHIAITGESSDTQEKVQNLLNMVGLEQDPGRIAWMLDTIYKLLNIPIPPKAEESTSLEVSNSKPTNLGQRAGDQQPVE